MRRCFVFLFMLVFNLANNTAVAKAAIPDTSSVHEISIYVIPSLSPLHWESPSSLHKSFYRGYYKSVFKKGVYVIGHMFIELYTPLLNQPILTAMRSASKQEKRRLVLKEKVGLAIMGATLQGRMENSEELRDIIERYKKKNKLAFITYRINRDAAKRIIAFLKGYTQKPDGIHSPSNYYGGAFWPRYENEGGGCASFGLSVLDVAGLQYKHEEWKNDVKIPLSLIGGEYNRNLKINKRDIRQTNGWFNSHGTENVDFAVLEMYDPSKIFDWILKLRNEVDLISETNFVRVEKNGIPGLYIDCRDIQAPVNEPIFIQRTQNSLFIDSFRKKNGSN